MGAIVLFAIMFSLYVASILIPILLFVIVVSGLVNLCLYIYKRYKFGEQKTRSSLKKKNIEIIDAEYEIIDDK